MFPTSPRFTSKLLHLLAIGILLLPIGVSHADDSPFSLLTDSTAIGTLIKQTKGTGAGRNKIAQSLLNQVAIVTSALDAAPKNSLTIKDAVGIIQNKSDSAVRDALSVSDSDLADPDIKADVDKTVAAWDVVINKVLTAAASQAVGSAKPDPVDLKNTDSTKTQAFRDAMKKYVVPGLTSFVDAGTNANQQLPPVINVDGMSTTALTTYLNYGSGASRIGCCPCGKLRCYRQFRAQQQAQSASSNCNCNR